MNTTKREFVLLTDKFAKILFNTKVGQKYLTKLIKSKSKVNPSYCNSIGFAERYLLVNINNQGYKDDIENRKTR